MSYREPCINMVKQQLRSGGVLDEKVLNLFETVPREIFVPEPYQSMAYADLQIPFDHKQVMLTPLEAGLLLQALELTGKERVLEVGTGTGYLTALLSKSAGQVISVDYFADLTAAALQRLQDQGCDPVELITGDASRGWIDKAPYDRIVFTGAIERIDPSLPMQLLPGGKLAVIIGRAPVMQAKLFSLDHQGEWTQRFLFETNVPLLVDKSRVEPFQF